MDWGTVALSLAAALLGTYLGARVMVFYQDRKVQKIRNIAIKALCIILEFAKNKNSYKKSEDRFNNDLNNAEKRAVLVALHKIGVPISMTASGPFSIKSITFLEEEIDKQYINDLIVQIENGYCDNLFFADIDSYFNENLRIRAARDIAKRYVRDVLTETVMNGDIQKLPDGWPEKFTPGEFNVLYVFFRRTCHTQYYNLSDGKFKKENVDKLTREIDLGIWDVYLGWDIVAYEAMLSQKNYSDAALRQYNTQQAPQVSAP